LLPHRRVFMGSTTIAPSWCQPPKLKLPEKESFLYVKLLPHRRVFVGPL
jgi:hypothetical protein